MMKLILNELKSSSAVQALLRNEEGLSALSLNEEAVILAGYYQQTSESIIVVKNNLFQAQQLYLHLESLLDEEVFLFASEESLRIESIAASPEILAQKIEVLHQLQEKEKIICITHAAAFTRYLPDPEYFKRQKIHLQLGQEVTMNELRDQLIHNGYELVYKVDQPLTFSIRGGIVDVFSMNNEYPIRIEFFDTIIDSIRIFDIATQRTLSAISEANIIPATDILLSDDEVKEVEEKVRNRLEKERDKEGSGILAENVEQELSYLANRIRDNRLYRYYAFLEQQYTLLDYRKEAFLILSTPEEIAVNLRLVTEETVSYLQELYQDHRALLTFQVYAPFNQALGGKSCYEIKQFGDVKKEIRSGIQPVYLAKQELSVALKIIAKEAKEKRILLCLSEAELKQVITACLQLNISYQMAQINKMQEPGIYLVHHNLLQGFQYQDFIVYSSRELFTTVYQKTRYSNKFNNAEVLHNTTDLEPGDYIVHNLYGVGRYLGIITKEINGNQRDFLRIVYRGEDILLVPLEQFNLVRKFVSSEGARPKLNKLGSNEWKKTKERIKENVADIAERLLALYSEREQAIGYAFQTDNEMQTEFEEEFEYELTKDQSRSVAEIKEDMESRKPMDRLLCGDVGFGKTEVAMRAAFKAVLEKKQVAYLCPTTILSRQHFETFLKRFINYPVQIAVLNRFVGETQQKKVIQDVKDGKVDVLIGTHRILSKDIKYKDLGLLIIDEEQRFGVEHKEKIKEMKNSIDVLSLSATPIPRTLQMSLIGIRSLSQLDSPPNHRMPVQTYVIEKNTAVIRDVIQRELARNGQVFYLHNNVSTLQSVAYSIGLKIPEAKIATVHGKMNRDEIEDVMVRFTLNEYNVLFCTTIIETGIDIPNANTIIIDQADRFGLSQLYQIKGRVGRSDRLAYAYLMYTPTKQLSEIAQKRLQAIKDFTELGSGYKIAMRDLTIRGAGDLLGGNQSGFIDTVGIDMYIELLKQAIDEKKGILPVEEEPVQKTPLNVNAYIPENFTRFDYDKISLYQKIENVRYILELEKLLLEIEDIFGKVPKEVHLLFEKKRLELILKEDFIEEYRENNKNVKIICAKGWSFLTDGVTLFKGINEIDVQIGLKYADERIVIDIPKNKDWLTKTIAVLKVVKQSQRV